MDLSEILIRPIQTEKADILREKNRTYEFHVRRSNNFEARNIPARKVHVFRNSRVYEKNSFFSWRQRPLFKKINRVFCFSGGNFQGFDHKECLCFQVRKKSILDCQYDFFRGLPIKKISWAWAKDNSTTSPLWCASGSLSCPARPFLSVRFPTASRNLSPRFGRGRSGSYTGSLHLNDFMQQRNVDQLYLLRRDI